MARESKVQLRNDVVIKTKLGNWKLFQKIIDFL